MIIKIIIIEINGPLWNKRRARHLLPARRKSMDWGRGINGIHSTARIGFNSSRKFKSINGAVDQSSSN